MRNINLILLADINSTTTIAYLNYFKKQFNCNEIIYFKIINKFSIQNIFKQALKLLFNHKNKILLNYSYSFKIQKIFKFKNIINYEHEFLKLNEKKYLKLNNFDELIPHVKKFKNSYFLYTDGGIVSKKFLENGIKLIHCHPGWLPDVRGTDCFFWSYLLKKSVSFTCFFMNSRIDDGKIILRKKFKLNIKKNNLLKLSYEQIYMLILYFVDPHYRAQTVIKLLSNNFNKINLGKLKSYSNNSNNGYYYRKMSAYLVKQVCKKILNDYKH